jgi:hypothetical protein
VEEKNVGFLRRRALRSDASLTTKILTKKKLQRAEVEMGHKKSFFLVRVKDLVFLNLREMLSFSKNSPKKNTQQSVILRVSAFKTFSEE